MSSTAMLNPMAAKGRALAAVVAVLASMALGLQLYLTVSAPSIGGLSGGQRIGNFFSYFTVLTNLLVAISLTASLAASRSRLGRFFSLPSAESAVAVYIAIVGLIYALLLRQAWDPRGAARLTDSLLHDAVPLLYVIYWLAYVRKSDLHWKHAFLWLVYPLAYVVYSLARGAITGWYPYPFVDVRALGYGIALRNAAGVLATFVAVGLLAVAVGRLRMQRPAR